MPEINFPDPSGSPFTDPAGKVWEHDGDGWRVQGITSVQPFTGLKNVLLNGDFRVNQRKFNGDWVALPNLKYGYDRWRASPGQTPPSIMQIVEIENVVEGVPYTLSWTGGGDGRIYRPNGVEIAFGPSPLTVPDIIEGFGGDPFVQVPMASTNMQLERGPDQTAFEVRPFNLELDMCRWYFRSLHYETLGLIATGMGAGTANAFVGPICEGMRGTTTVSINGGSYSNLLLVADGVSKVPLNLTADMGSAPFHSPLYLKIQADVVVVDKPYALKWTSGGNPDIALFLDAEFH